MESLQLVEFNPDETKSDVMVRAAELRSEGYDVSQALAMAWAEVSGDGADAGEDYEMMLEPRPRRRPRASNPTDADSGLGLGLLLGVGGYLLLCFFTSTYKGLPWSWTPWRTPAPISRQIRAPIITQSAATVIDHNSHKPLYQAKGFTEESIYLITP